MASTALLIGGLASAGIGAASSLGAASTQAGAANNAAQLQAQEAANALGFQEQQWNTTQQNEKPFLQAGTQALGTLENQLANPGAPNTTGSLVSTGAGQQYGTPFVAPTAAQAAATPGEQFALQQGQQAIQNSAAAQGNVLSGSTLKGLDAYSQGVASTYYQQAYNNALQQYQQGYNIFQQNQANQANRLAAMAGIGQTTAAQLGNQGQAAAGNVGNISMTAGQQIGQNINNAGAATASGYVGAGNALSNQLSGLSLLNYLNQGQGAQNQLSNTMPTGTPQNPIDVGDLIGG